MLFADSDPFKCMVSVMLLKHAFAAIVYIRSNGRIITRLVASKMRVAPRQSIPLLGALLLARLTGLLIPLRRSCALVLLFAGSGMTDHGSSMLLAGSVKFVV